MGLKHILIFAIKLLLKYEYFFNKNICLIKVGIYFIKNKFWYVNVNFKLKKKNLIHFYQKKNVVNVLEIAEY